MKKYFLGIDIGGTNTSFGIVQNDGTIECSYQLATHAYASFYELMQALKKCLKDNVPKLLEQITGVGVGTPMIHPVTGIISGAANINWPQPVNVKEVAAEIFRLDVITNNDANIVALGEWKFGRAKGASNFIAITLGTGVGGGIIINGQLIMGHSGLAGEVGHMLYESNGRVCKCGRKGCFERYISATGILESYHAFKKDYPNSILVQWQDKGVTLDAKKIFEAALLKDPLALEIYRFTGEILGLLLSNLVACFSPEKIILFGGVLRADEIIMQPTKKYFNDFLLSNFKNTVTIEVSNIGGADMGILGAVAPFID